jgi:ribosomal protein S18 acetylase RimI-like enzyme
LGKKAAELVVGQERRLDAVSLKRLKAIYLKSFPPSERDAFPKLVQHVSEGRGCLFTARLGGELVGFAVTMPLPRTDAHFLQYLAVAPRFRDRGIGSKLLGTVRQRLRRAGDASGLILEVEPDDRAPRKALRKRRIEFYRRNGARIVECAPHYRAPGPAGQGALDYMLMWLPFRGTAETPCGAVLRRLVRSIFVYGYGCHADEPSLRAVLRGLLRRHPQAEAARP